MPIRASAIRGNLRFWWRATRGSKCSDIEKLLKREGEIWGNTKEPSKITVKVDILSPGKRYPCAHLPEGKNFAKFERDHHPYVLFPFQGNSKKNIPISDCISGLSFRLTVTYPEEYLSDVESAIWAWINFGGIGARTRRGCGSLYCKHFAPENFNDFSKWYNSNKKHFTNNYTKKYTWPIFPENICIKKYDNQNALCAWYNVAELLSNFRQGSQTGRNPGQEKKRPGRSRWPEPESIREITGKRDNKNRRMDNIPLNSFPRSEFGLPIIFHFKDKKDPFETELVPEINGIEKLRMASPLILKTLKCKNEDIIQLVFAMNTQEPDNILLKSVEKRNEIKKSNKLKIRSPEFSEYQNSPMGSRIANEPKRSPKGSALEAFISFAEENGFTEVA